MNEKIVAILGVFAIVVVIASLGCLGGGSSAKDMAKMTPDDKSVLVYMNLQTMRDDKDLEDIYEKMAESLDEDEDNPGVDINTINYVAIMITSSLTSMTPGNMKGLVIIGGNFDLGDVREELEDQGCEEDKYKGVEFWTEEDNDATAVFKDMLIGGDDKSVKNCIKVMKGDRTSLYDDDDVKEVIDKLPDGIVIVVSTECSYENAPAGGFVLIKEDEDTVKWKGVIKFDDEDDAEDTKSNIKRELKKQDGVFAVTVKQSGQFLELSAKMDIEDWEKGMEIAME